MKQRQNISPPSSNKPTLLYRGDLMHLAPVANILLKDEGSARGDHVLTRNFSKYSLISIFSPTDSAINLS